jgi:hypothetical protein
VLYQTETHQYAQLNFSARFLNLKEAINVMLVWFFLPSFNGVIFCDIYLRSCGPALVVNLNLLIKVL